MSGLESITLSNPFQDSDSDFDETTNRTPSVPIKKRRYNEAISVHQTYTTPTHAGITSSAYCTSITSDLHRIRHTKRQFKGCLSTANKYCKDRNVHRLLYTLEDAAILNNLLKSLESGHHSAKQIVHVFSSVTPLSHDTEVRQL